MSLQDKARRYWRVVVLVIGALCIVAGLIGYGQGGRDKQGSAQEGFVNKVWQIKTSNSIEPGMLYVFLSDGTLVMASPSSQPSLGRWTRTEKGLNMIEEGITLSHGNPQPQPRRIPYPQPQSRRSGRAATGPGGALRRLQASSE